MKKGGFGGGNTLSGLHFESRVSLRAVIESLENYSVDNENVKFNGKTVAKLYPKHDLYKKLLEPMGVDYKRKISKKLLPDDAIFSISTNTIHIVEIKFQEVAGSVDEKLQTCDFKNKQYNKLFSTLNIKVKYIYVLNDWFKKPEYSDVLSYITSVGCYYFFNDVPLSELGLK